MCNVRIAGCFWIDQDLPVARPMQLLKQRVFLELNIQHLTEVYLKYYFWISIIGRKYFNTPSHFGNPRNLKHFLVAALPFPKMNVSVLSSFSQHTFLSCWAELLDFEMFTDTADHSVLSHSTGIDLIEIPHRVYLVVTPSMFYVLKFQSIIKESI